MTSVHGLGLTTLVMEVTEDRQGAGEHGLTLGETDGGMARFGQVAAAGAEDGSLATAIAALPTGGNGRSWTTSKDAQ